MSKNGLACIYIKYKEVTMVFGNIDNLKEYSFLEDKVTKCFEYAKEHDLLQYE